MLYKVEPSSTFCNDFFQLATLKFVARQVEHAVVIRATTRSTCNAMLRDKLNKNFARIIAIIISNFGSSFGDQWHDFKFPFMGISIVCSNERLLLPEQRSERTDA